MGRSTFSISTRWPLPPPSSTELPAGLARKRLDYPRHGLPWDEAEDQRLVAAFEQGATVEALCAQHERNANAIRARLVKHGLLEDDRPSRRGET